jgi:NADPH2:quinone reductase
MRCFAISDYGDTPHLTQRPLPAPGPGEIAVQIRAAALNFADLLMAKGRYQERPTPPVTLGMECAGEITALGPDVAGFALGDRVAVYSGQGGLAEAGVFPAARAVKLPDAMPYDAAAGMLIAHGTSHLALQPGETLLVLGASGGVGLTAVEIGKRLGARVIACARGPQKLEVARAAGADHLIDTQSQDIRHEVLALGGADVAYDPVGGADYTAAFRSLRPEGRLLVIGFASGDLPEVKPNHMLVKNIALIGLNLGAYLQFAPEALAESFAELFAWYAAGEIDVHISHRYRLDQAAEALEMLRSRQATGKIIVTP